MLQSNRAAKHISFKTKYSRVNGEMNLYMHCYKNSGMLKKTNLFKTTANTLCI